MSVGPGKLQSAILTALRKTPKQFNILLWEIAENLGKINKVPNNIVGLENGQISKSFYNNFLRAIKSLKGKKLILVKEMKISNLDDLIKYYPFKTRELEIRYLREKFLPLIVNFIKTQNSFPFSAPQVEENTIAQLRMNSSNYSQLVSEWVEIQEEIKIYFLSSKMFSIEITDLLYKGMELILSNNKTIVNDTLGNLINVVQSNSLINEPISNKLYLFYEKYFVKGSLDRNMFKNIMYSVVSISKSQGSSNVTANFKKFLYENEPDLISSLPGHITPKELVKDRWYQIGEQEIIYSSLIDRIIERHLFTDFIFLEIS